MDAETLNINQCIDCVNESPVGTLKYVLSYVKAVVEHNNIIL